MFCFFNFSKFWLSLTCSLGLRPQEDARLVVVIANERCARVVLPRSSLLTSHWHTRLAFLDHMFAVTVYVAAMAHPAYASGCFLNLPPACRNLGAKPYRTVHGQSYVLRILLSLLRVLLLLMMMMLNRTPQRQAVPCSHTLSAVFRQLQCKAAARSSRCATRSFSCR